MSAACAAVSRQNFAFSADGRRATCIRGGDGHHALETWSFDRGSGQARRRLFDGGMGRAAPCLGRGTHALPLRDGRVLVFPNESERQELLLIEPSEVQPPVRLARIRALGGYLLPSPDPAQLGFLVTRDEVDRSTLWRITASSGDVRAVLRLPGAMSGGVWMGHDASWLAADLASGDRPAEGVLLDLVHGTWNRLFTVSDHSSDRIVAYAPRSRLLVVSTDVSGEDRLGCVRLDDGRPVVRSPEALASPGRGLRGLAMDDDGTRLLVCEQRGAASQLSVYTAAEERLESLSIPRGVVGLGAVWCGRQIRVPFSAPAVPPTVLTLSLPDGPPSGSDPTYADTDEAREHAWAEADLVPLEGASGTLEAVVYGGPSWRSSEHLVLALHGGPISSWRFDFDPLFQALAAAGIAVVAPNYRGSTGYGRAHMRAVVGAWGGPDLADVLHIGHVLAAERARAGLRPPVVFGVSYGAFLALLAAAYGPRLWASCIAAAPFMSGQLLHDSGPPWVARRLRTLGALTPPADDAGPRDVLPLCPEIAVPLLLVHGTRDEVVPVEQSRMLRRRLLELGWNEDLDFHYREVAGDHEDVTRAEARAQRELLVSFCLSATPRGRPPKAPEGFAREPVHR